VPGAAGLFNPLNAVLTLLSPEAGNLSAASDSGLVGHGLPRPDSMPSAAGDTYSPGPDPDFSYLSLLQPNLLFVQDIRRYVDLAASLGAMADSMEGQAGSSLLALRAQVLQYGGGGNAWNLMMADAGAQHGDWEPAMTYQTAAGHVVPIYDAFLPSATTPDLYFTYYLVPSDLVSLRQYFDELPPLVLQYEHYIVFGPVGAMVGWAGYTWIGGDGGGSSIDGAHNASVFPYQTIPHEIAGTLFGGLSGTLSRQEWDALWTASTEPVWDTVDTVSYYPPWSTIANSGIPWGDQSEFEDFMSIASDWANDSGTPRAIPNQSTSVLEEAVHFAALGHPILLQKVLIMAALFTTTPPVEMHLYHFTNLGVYQAPPGDGPAAYWPVTPSVANPILSTVSPIQVTPTSLALTIPLPGGAHGDYTFTIQNGLLTGGTSPASQVEFGQPGTIANIPEWDFTFPTPVPIPAYAATAWGIPQ
jgi:hypothetical protein